MRTTKADLGKLMLVALALTVAGACQSLGDERAKGLAKPPATLEQDARSPALYLSVIEQLIENGKAYAALAHLDEYERAYGHAPWARKLRADAKFALGAISESETDYQAISKGDLAGYGKNGLGRIAAVRGNWDLAARNFQEAVRAQPTNSEFLRDFGQALQKLGRVEEAELNLRKAEELSPSNPAIMANLGNLAAGSGISLRVVDSTNPPAETLAPPALECVPASPGTELQCPQR